MDDTQARRRLTAARQRYERAGPDLRAAVLDALRSGVPIGQVAELSGYSRMHVRRIRDEQQDCPDL